MIQVGQPIPEATVWLRPREPISLAELASGGTVLFLFYLFDWSST